MGSSSLTTCLPEVDFCTEVGIENPCGFSLQVIFFHFNSVKNMKGVSLIIRKQPLHLLFEWTKASMLPR